MALLSVIKLLLTALFLISITACSQPAPIQITASPIPIQALATETTIPLLPPTQEIVTPLPEPTIGKIEPTLTRQQVYNPCNDSGSVYHQDLKLGEIEGEYIGSWHAAPFVGAGFEPRFVFLPNGNYFYFPSQFECASGDAACIPSPFVFGTWGVQGDRLNLAENGDMNSIRVILLGEVIQASPDESPYPFKAYIGQSAYWQVSKETNLWNPVTGEYCP